MIRLKAASSKPAILIFLVTILCVPLLLSQQKKPMTFEDVMKFKAVTDSIISENGLWIAYSAQPDRGDGEARIQSTKGDKEYVIERGIKPQFSKNSRWTAAAVKSRAVDLEKAEKDKPKQGMALLEIETGKLSTFENVERFIFSDDSGWLAYQFFKEEEKKEPKEQKEEEKAKKTKRETGSTLILRHLSSGKEYRIPYVTSFAFDGTSRFLAYAVFEPEGKENGLYCRNLGGEDAPEKIVVKKEDGLFAALTWSKKDGRLAFFSGILEENKETIPVSLEIWDGKTGRLVPAVAADAEPQGWIIPHKSQLSWSESGSLLFFGLKPMDEVLEEAGKQNSEAPAKKEEVDLFDIEQILKKREVDVWHWNDTRIIPHQKKLWPRMKDRTYLAVYHADKGKVVPLADKKMPMVAIPDNDFFALGFSEIPYLKEITWDGNYSDVFLVNLSDGSRQKIVSRLEGRPSLSPRGRYVAYYRDLHWHLFDGKTGKTRNLTDGLKGSFHNEEHDLPAPPRGFGLAGWVEDEASVLIYDRYDIWQLPTAPDRKPLNITEGKGREEGFSFRVLRLDPEKQFFRKDENFLLSAYHNLEKHTGFFAARVGKEGVRKLMEERKKFTFLAKAGAAGVLIYTRESYDEFPDIWVSDLSFSSPRKLTDVNPQIKDFAWGTAELIDWISADGIPLQGVLIKTGNYEPGRQYPVLVYYYELFSQRLYEFNQPVVNHRPCFPFYASNGYVLFLPDVRYEVGQPGFSATKCLVPGVQKLIDMGVADPKAIALHGHSWSGYQTALVITQSNIFAAAIAGAPVSNMTSAYSGIRWESGLARQFQYERAQSRIGKSLWEAPHLYIENSPVFYADRIKTPLLIQFGDEDGAVPWHQGIELYLAMRRLGKDCIFLQYRGEPHHLQKYANKMDYARKMKEYLDHYLRVGPAPNWIKQGIPYTGK